MAEHLNEVASSTTNSQEQELEDLISFNPVDRIKQGFFYFKMQEFNKFPWYYRQLAEAQNPKFLVFACSDSRVSPTNILKFRPGEAFMNRNVGNFVPVFNQLKYSETGAIIEYAVSELKVETILVIGHSRCGGIRALMELNDDGNSSGNNDFIDDWVKNGLPAKLKVKSEFGDLPEEKQTEILERESVNLSLRNLLTYPYVKAGLASKKLELMGGYYNFINGKFELWKMDSVNKENLSI